jgi:hypothetical protein
LIRVSLKTLLLYLELCRLAAKPLRLLKENNMANRVYWVGLLLIVRKLCKYWLRYGGKMPSDLPASVSTAMTAVTIACTALEAYDLATANGKPDEAALGDF